MPENTKKRISTSLVTLAYIFCGITILCSAFVLIKALSVGEKLIAVADIIVAAIAILYFAKGFSKDASKYYRMLFLTVAASILLDAVFTCFIEDTSDVIGIGWIFIALIFYGNMMILGVAKDLGKTASLFLILSCTLLYTAVMVAYMISWLSNPSDMVAFTDFMNGLAWFFGALVGVIMVIAKYSDKAVRGTK